jgi:integrase
MARVKDLWFSEVKDPKDPEKKIKKKTKRHPDNGGSKDAKRWLAVWIDPDGDEKTKAFRIKDAASRYARDQEVDVARDEYIDPNAGKELLGLLGKRWLRLRNVGAASDVRYEGVFRLHVEPTFGHRQVRSVKPSEVLEWLLALTKTHGYATQDKAYMVLSGIFDLAVADGMRKDNPAKSPIIPKPKEDPAEREPWTVERVWSVTDAHPEPYRLIPIVKAACGLRIGEALGLAKEDFDFENGKLNIRRQVARVNGVLCFKLPKGGKERTTPLSPGVARAVKAYSEAYPPSPYTLPWMQEKGAGLAEDPHTCTLLFRWHGDDKRTHGKHIRAHTYDQRVWKPALFAAGVIDEPTADERGRKEYHSDRDDTTHALRHYFVTTLLDAGVSLAGVMEFAGHSKKGAPVTLGVYAHVTDETFEAARNAIDRSLFRLRAVQDRPANGTAAERVASR